MLNLPEQGYTPANYAKLVELTQLSNVAVCELFDIPKGTFEKHKAGTRTMKWQDWQYLIESVKRYLTMEQKNMSETYKARSHSQAVRFMMKYHVGMCGFEVVAPTHHKKGVFSVISRVEDGVLLTLLDNKTIEQSDKKGRHPFLMTDFDYQKAYDDYSDIRSMADQVE